MARRVSGDGPKEYRLVLRDASPLVAFGLIAVLAAVFVVDGFVRRGVDAGLPTLAIAVGPIAALWLVLVHPHVRWNPREVVVTNIGRVHRLPWPSIVTIRQNRGLGFGLVDGRTVVAVAVSAPRDRGLVMSAITRGKFGVGSVEIHRHADALRSYQESEALRLPAGAPAPLPTTGWDVRPLAVAGGLLLFSLVVAAATILPSG